MRTVYWIRHDLRVVDNPALAWVVAKSHETVFLWCEPLTWRRAGPRRRAFLEGSLREFEREVARRGQRVLRAGGAIGDAIRRVRTECGEIDALVFASEPGTEEARAEAEALAAAPHARVVSFDSGGLIEATDLPFPAGSLPLQFTSFRKAVEAACAPRTALEAPEMPWPQPPASLPADLGDERRPLEVASGLDARFVPGERAGLARIEHVLWGTDSIRTYKDTRNGMLNFDDSTKLSPWLASGAISARFVYSRLKAYEQDRGANDSTYWLYFELLWREYMRLYVRSLGTRAFLRQGTKALKTPVLARSDELDAFAAWSAGETGQPFIDANMRELSETGWMSNRGRQNVASYLAKTMKVDWRLGAEWFERQLVDYDVANNWGNWTYVAGVGADPRDRVFNPEVQARVYDPEGEYVKRWSRR